VKRAGKMRKKKKILTKTKNKNKPFVGGVDFVGTSEVTETDVSAIQLVKVWLESDGVVMVNQDGVERDGFHEERGGSC
jgi:hypothetical protein